MITPPSTTFDNTPFTAKGKPMFRNAIGRPFIVTVNEESRPTDAKALKRQPHDTGQRA